jgi:hypothetical protein
MKIEKPGVRPRWLQRMISEWKSRIGFSILQYALAIAAVANVFSVSYQLGLRTLLAWKCNSSYLPFLWAILPAGIHLIAALAWRASNTMQRVRKRKLQRGAGTQPSSSTSGVWVLSLRTWLEDEVQLSIDGQKQGYYRSSSSSMELSRTKAAVNSPGEGWITELLMELMAVFAFVHVAFGTLIFSSLMFIATIDAAIVIIRYFVSGLLCRAILIFEVNGIRVAESGQDEQSVELVSGEQG